MTATKKAIPAHNDLMLFEYVCDELNGVVLSCLFEYEPEEIGSIEPMSGMKLEPDYPECYTLTYVHLPDGLEIFGILHESILQDIQEYAVDFFEEQRMERANW